MAQVAGRTYRSKAKMAYGSYYELLKLVRSIIRIECVEVTRMTTYLLVYD